MTSPHERLAHASAQQVITDAITARQMPRIRQHMKKVIADRAMPAGAKTRALYDAIDGLAREVMPHSQCRRGCAHCCHIAVAINQAEAELIARKTGLQPVIPTNRSMEGKEAFADSVPLGYSDPCPFLKDSECSIYDVRPLACREHFNLDVSADLCRLDETRPVLMYGHLALDQMAVAAAGGPFRITIADIREFFPPGHRPDDHTSEPSP